MLTESETAAAMLRNTQRAVERVEHAMGLDTPTCYLRRQLLTLATQHLDDALSAVSEATVGLQLDGRIEVASEIQAARGAVSRMLADLDRGAKKEVR